MEAKPKSDYSGRFGDIWKYSDGVYRAIEFTPDGNEHLRKDIPERDLALWLKRLRVPTSEAAQTIFRNSFPSTKEQIQKRFRGHRK